jgi:hypothetical protein
MFKIGLTALAALPLTFAAAQAFDSFGANRAATYFGQYGVNGLAVAGRTNAQFGDAGETPQYGYAGENFAGVPAYAPRCWTRYVTAANGNTLVNMPYTVCR